MNAMRRFMSVLSAMLVVAVTGACANAQFAPLLQRIPESANAIFLLNAEKVFNSELALREGWRQNFEKAMEAGLMHIPADTQQYVWASELDFDSMQPAWQVGVVKVKDKRDVAVAAKKLGGKQDTVSSHPAVLLPSGDYIVQCDPTTLAVLVPAGRQAVARWLSSTEKATPKFTDYIQEAIGYSEKSGTELILALDLKDVIDPNDVKERLAGSSFGSDKKIDVDALTAVLVSLNGVMLGVTLGEKPFGSIKVDFGRDATALQGLASQILLDALARQGAMIDDFRSWKEVVKGNQITFSGYFTHTGLRKVMSLMDIPITWTVTDDEPAPVSPGDQDPKAVAAQRYFGSVNQFFEDLRDKEPQRIAQYGVWFEKYARKIDQLPMVNVDSDMLDYGAYVSQQLRNAAVAIQGIGIRSRVRQVEAAQSSGGVPSYYGAAYNGSYTYGGNSYYGNNSFARGNYMQEGVRQQFQARTQVKVQEKAAGASAARAILKDIDNANALVRRQMTEKYQVDF
jgi:hypothetical protein